MSDENTSSLENFLSRKVNRRGFIRDVLVAGSALMEVNCKVDANSTQPIKVDTQPPSADKRVTLREVTPSITKAEVRSFIEGLSPSPYKDFVMTFGYLLFQDNPPKNINLSGVEIMVADSRVKDGEDQKNIGGRASIRTVQQGKIFKLQQDHAFGILLPYMDNEFIRTHVDFSANQDFVQGIEPEIIWVAPKTSTIPQSEVNNYRRIREFSMIKEAFTIAFVIAFMGEVIKNMQANQYPVDFDDNGQKVEGISQSLIHIINTQGKLAALYDVVPYVLSAKAMQTNQSLMEAMRKDPAHIKILDAISKQDFGSPNEMVGNSIRFILQNKDTMKGSSGYFIGDLDQPY